MSWWDFQAIEAEDKKSEPVSESAESGLTPCTAALTTPLLPPLEPKQRDAFTLVHFPLARFIVLHDLRIEVFSEHRQEPFVRLSINGLFVPYNLRDVRTFLRFFQQNRISTGLPSGARSHSVLTSRGNAGCVYQSYSTYFKELDSPRSRRNLRPESRRPPPPARQREECPSRILLYGYWASRHSSRR